MALKKLFPVIIVIFLISDIISINNGIAWDAEIYYSMSSQIVNGER